MYVKERLSSHLIEEEFNEVQAIFDSWQKILEDSKQDEEYANSDECKRFEQKGLDIMKSILSKLEYQASSMPQEDILTLKVTIGNFYDDNYSKQVEVKVSKEFYDKLVNFADIVEYGKALEALVHIIQNKVKDLPEDWSIERIEVK